MIQRDIKIDELIGELSSSFDMEKSNIDNAIMPFQTEVKKLLSDAPFLNNKAPYLYCLAQYGDFIVNFPNSRFLTFYGFGFWDDTNIFDYSIIDEKGFFLIADLTNESGDLDYYKFNTKDDDGVLWRMSEGSEVHERTNFNLYDFFTFLLAL